MSLILSPGQVCPHASVCPHNEGNECWGANSARPTTFHCDFIKDGKITEQGFRNPYDQTGKMKIITG